MPQLDKLTVLSNVFWFSCCFFLFYLLVLKYAIPRLVRLVMFRKLAAQDQAGGSLARPSENLPLGGSEPKSQRGWVPVAQTLGKGLGHIRPLEVAPEGGVYLAAHIQGCIVELGHAGARHAMLLEQTNFELGLPWSQISIISLTLFTDE
uniref:ATP synthase subunit 8 n=1 Tax=Caulerpa ashmeadii TaxID=177078 RepID=A0A6B9VWG0_9CHLO|nr:ATP synthase subunit 8 [Caulerpa ashmeadii]QHQ73227.1 ATP synthase subunit 8 [Caulerpa ashmeadii]